MSEFGPALGGFELETKERNRRIAECRRHLEALAEHHRPMWRANLIAAHKAQNDPAAGSR